MMEDTKIGGPSGKFPATRWSAVLASRSDDPAERSRALEAIAGAYWKPIYKYLRIRWGKSSEDAKDLTQEFFAKLFEKEYLNDFDPAKARLRTFLRVCVDRFVANDFKAATRLKRGGGAFARFAGFRRRGSGAGTGEAGSRIHRIAGIDRRLS